MALIFHSFKGFSDLEDFWDDLPVSRLKYNVLDDFQEVFQTTSCKSSDGVFSHVSLFHNRSERFDLEDFWDDLPVSRLKYNALDDFQEVFQRTSRKSSRQLPGSRPDFLEVVWIPGSLLTNQDRPWPKAGEAGALGAKLGAWFKCKGAPNIYFALGRTKYWVGPVFS
ncbi:hypothetical protein YC2023_059277 [Brassica napus]